MSALEGMPGSRGIKKAGWEKLIKDGRKWTVMIKRIGEAVTNEMPCNNVVQLHTCLLTSRLKGTGSNYNVRTQAQKQYKYVTMYK